MAPFIGECSDGGGNSVDNTGSYNKPGAVGIPVKSARNHEDTAS